MPMMYGGYGLGIGGFFMMLFMMLIPLAILGLVVYWAVGLGMKKSFKGNSTNSLEILKERYARGEITTEEYQKIKEDLLK